MDVDISTAVNFTCGLVTSGDHEEPKLANCTSKINHSLPVADKQPFGKKYSVTVRVDYIECQNLSSTSQVAGKA